MGSYWGGGGGGPFLDPVGRLGKGRAGVITSCVKQCWWIRTWRGSSVGILGV